MRLYEFDLLPEQAFRTTTGKRFGRLLTLEGGKGASANAPAPDPNIGIAQKQLADLATQQWHDFKSDIYPELLKQTNQQLAMAQAQSDMTNQVSQFQLGQAKDAYSRYQEGAIPAMQALKSDADLYNQAGHQEELAGQAAGDIRTQMDNQRAAEAMRQRSYGINPNSGAATANNQSISVQQSLAEAAAATQTRQAAHDIGLQKQAAVYNMYAGLPAQANANTSLALQASGQGLAGNMSGLQALGMTGASLNAAAGTAMGGFGQMGQLGVGSYNADVGAYKATSQAQATSSAGFGQGIGGLAMAGALAYAGNNRSPLAGGLYQLPKPGN